MSKIGKKTDFILSLEFEIIFKGSDAAERTDILYAISDEDHPAAALMKSPYKATKGTATLVGLNIREVRL
jgi:hypothetical protein